VIITALCWFLAGSNIHSIVLKYVHCIPFANVQIMKERLVVNMHLTGNSLNK